jgi:hypothetical protein
MIWSVIETEIRSNLMRKPPLQLKNGNTDNGMEETSLDVGPWCTKFYKLTEKENTWELHSPTNITNLFQLALIH